LVNGKSQKENQECLLKVFEQFRNFTSVIINSKEYKIVQKFGGDFKFIEETFGLCGANGKYSCIYCEINLKTRWTEGDHDKIYKITRTLAKSKAINLANYPKNSEKKKGYFNSTIMHIDFNMIVVDLLHILLRISDKLIEALIFILNSNDKDSSSNDFSKRQNLKKFYTILSDKCKITKPYYLSSVDKNEKINLKSLNGSERELMFKYFQENTLAEQFSDIDEMKSFSLVFNDWWNLYCEIKEYKVADNLIELDKKLRQWLLKYIPFVNTLESTISPYIHIFVFHIKELLELHGNINFYNLQGLEKLNSLQTKVYFCNTNRHRNDNEYIKQLVDNRNRTDFRNLEGTIFDIDTGENI
jgi:hypothetical protein